MTYTTILVDIADGIATITLNRPERLNCFNRAMVLEFRELWKQLRADTSVRVLVLRAAPGRAFCSGVDVKEGWRAPGEELMPFDQEDPGESLGPKSNHVWKPLIIAVHGMAAGGAFYWLNEADIVICSEEATFFDSHVSNGMVSAIEPVGLMRHIGLHETLRMALSGNDERVSSQTALRIGIVSEVVTRAELWPRAHELAARIAAKPSAATQGTVRAIWESLDRPYRAAMEQGLLYTRVGNPIGMAAAASSEDDGSSGGSAGSPEIR